MLTIQDLTAAPPESSVYVDPIGQLVDERLELAPLYVG